MEITSGTVFNTPAEAGCVAVEAPDRSGQFVGRAPDGVECSYSTVMVCGYGHPSHQHVPHACQEADRPDQEPMTQRERNVHQLLDRARKARDVNDITQAEQLERMAERLADRA